MFLGKLVNSYKKYLILSAALVILGSYAVHEAGANASGVVGQSKVGCGGYGCHGTKATATVISLTTTSSTLIAGQTYVFRLSVANPSEAGAGCDISVDNSAKLAVNGYNSGLFVFNNELTHNGPRSFTGDSAVWTFKYTPTKTGVSHIYVACNAVNLNGTNDNGDHWNTLVFTTTVAAPDGPQIVVPTLARDTAHVGDSVTSSFWIKNVGNALLSIDHYAFKVGTYFSASDSSAHTIAVGDSAKFIYTFKPTVVGQKVDTLHIYTNEGYLPIASVPLIGVGLAQAGVSDGGAANVSVMVSPNPSHGILQITATRLSGHATMQLLDAAGRIVLTREADLTEATSLDARSLPAGSYLLVIQPEQGERIVRKVVLR